MHPGSPKAPLLEDLRLPILVLAPALTVNLIEDLILNRGHYLVMCENATFRCEKLE